MSWADARKACKEDGSRSDVASIHSPFETGKNLLHFRNTGVSPDWSKEKNSVTECEPSFGITSEALCHILCAAVFIVEVIPVLIVDDVWESSSDMSSCR